MLGIDPLIKDIEGHEKKYQISEDGIVYNKLNGSELSQYIRSEYYTCSLNKKMFSVHRLLAITFIPNPENKPYVDHIDRNRSNNKLENLRWCTNQENNRNTESTGYSIRLDKRTGIKYYRGYISTGSNRISKQFPFNELGFEQVKEWRLIQEKLYFKEFSSKTNIKLLNVDMTPQLHKTNTSGHKYISITKCNTYKVYLIKLNISKTFKTLDEAVRFRDEKLK